MIHAFFLRDGRATYRNRYVRTAGLLAEMKAGRALYRSFMNGGPIIELPPDLPPSKNPGNTNVAGFAARLLVFSEGDVPHELQARSLDTLGQFDFQGAVRGPTTAHFKVDPVNGDLLFFGAFGSQITWYRANRSGAVLESHVFDMGVPSFIHDFTVTEDYAVFFVNPMLIRMDAMMEGKPSTVWEPEHGNRIALLERRTGDVKWFSIEGAFAPTHFLNAYQEGSTVVVDGNRCDSLFSPTAAKNPFIPAYPWRWKLDVASGTVRDGAVAEFISDFPRINDMRTARKHRFGYYSATRGKQFCDDWLFDCLAKHDYERDRTEFQDMGGALNAPSEVVFVPRDGATTEDDGWLLSIWWDPATDRSELLIQNAQDFSGHPLARVKLQHRVPLGFHGNWVPANSSS